MAASNRSFSLLDELETLLCKKAEEESGKDVPADIDTILASTEKLLAINRGEAEPDERDSLEFKRIHSPADLLAERIEMDAGNLRSIAMRRIAKTKSLKPIGVAHFDPYSEGLILGNPLSMPLEETNPLSLLEQSRRVSAMGPGGLSSDDSISEEATALHPSTFGFLSSFESPESSRAGVDSRASWKTRVGSDGRIYRRLKHVPSGKDKWVSASDLHNAVVGMPE